MADRVQFALEKLVPVLRDLEAKQIFDEKELRSIVDKRKAFEYTLSARGTSKHDFLKYIKYEITLEVVRRTRTKKMGFKKEHKLNSVGIARICGLFSKALQRFKSDKPFWFQYIDFCLQSGATKNMQAAVLRALRWHPKEASLWILAADRELKLGHVNAARTMLKRGIRCAPNDPKLWVEYLKLECITVHKMAIAKIVKDNESPDPVPVAVALVTSSHAVKSLEGASRVSFIKQALEICDRLCATPDARAMVMLDQWRASLMAAVAANEELDEDLSVLLWAERIQSESEPMYQTFIEESMTDKYAFRVPRLIRFLIREQPSLLKTLPVEKIVDANLAAEVLTALGSDGGEFVSQAAPLVRKAQQPRAQFLWAMWRFQDHDVTEEDLKEILSDKTVSEEYLLPLCTLLRPEPELFLNCCLAVEGSKREFVVPLIAARDEQFLAKCVSELSKRSLAVEEASEIKIWMYFGGVMQQSDVASAAELFEAGVKQARNCSPDTEALWWAMYVKWCDEMADRGVEVANKPHRRAQKEVRDTTAYLDHVGR